MRAFTLLSLLILAGCDHALLAPNDLTGQWARPITIPGSGFGFTLTQAGDSVFGSGTYAIEAGRAGTVAVAGRYDQPAVRLQIVYDYGLRLEFVGQVVERRMNGAVTDSLGRSSSLVLVRQ
jgi:hypothetical protein